MLWVPTRHNEHLEHVLNKSEKACEEPWRDQRLLNHLLRYLSENSYLVQDAKIQHTTLYGKELGNISQTVVGLLRQEAWVKFPSSMAIFLTFVNNSKSLSFEYMFWYWENFHIYPYVCMYTCVYTCTHDCLWVHNAYASIYIVINYLPILCQLWKGFIAVSFRIGGKSVPT